MQHLSEIQQPRRGRLRLLSLQELRTQKGISYSRHHLLRLIKAKRFPAPIKLGENRNAWPEDEIDRWIAARIEERDTAREGA
jgi:prophage regulatory protein